MEIITDLSSFSSDIQYAVTIGNFDGVHTGHKRLIDKLKEVAEKDNLKTGILTFNPHPLKFFNNSIKLINTREQKQQIFEEYNIDTLFLIPFNENIAGIEPSVFVNDVLCKTLKAKYIIVGHDYHFGKKRRGNYTLLQNMGETCGFTPIRIPKVTVDNMTVSSTNIRKFVENGEVEKATSMLGRPYSVTGTVIRGDGLASKLGFPTANIHPDNELMPASGVYATRTLVNGKMHNSVTYFGNRPTFNGIDLYRVETNIFDLNEDLYGKRAEVFLLKRERGDMRFNGVEALKEQIAIDVENTKRYFGELGK